MITANSGILLNQKYGTYQTVISSNRSPFAFIYFLLDASYLNPMLNTIHCEVSIELTLKTISSLAWKQLSMYIKEHEISNFEMLLCPHHVVDTFHANEENWSYWGKIRPFWREQGSNGYCVDHPVTFAYGPSGLVLVNNRESSNGRLLLLSLVSHDTHWYQFITAKIRYSWLSTGVILHERKFLYKNLINFISVSFN